MVANCQVCSEQAFKYKCPTCIIPYCSVNCFKKHRDHCVPTVPEPTAALTATGGAGGGVIDEYKFQTKDTVPLEKLELLGSSGELKGLLRNPHLQNFLKTIDSSDNPQRLMRKAMHEPLFVEFVDECLKVLEPAGQQLTDQQVLDIVQKEIDEN